MKNFKLLIPVITLATILFGCSKKEDIDTEYPIIENSYSEAFPKPCSIVKRGERFVFKARFSDNVELGAISLDVHNNFDHHNHGTEVSDCELGPKKVAIKDFKLVQSFNIPAGSKTYEIQQEINVPADVDAGDYHFLIRVTDKAGWQTIKGFGIKVE